MPSDGEKGVTDGEGNVLVSQSPKPGTVLPVAD
jgi:hypothetical protein